MTTAEHLKGHAKQKGAIRALVKKRMDRLEARLAGARLDGERRGQELMSGSASSAMGKFLGRTRSVNSMSLIDDAEKARRGFSKAWLLQNHPGASRAEEMKYLIIY